MKKLFIGFILGGSLLLGGVKATAASEYDVINYDMGSKAETVIDYDYIASLAKQLSTEPFNPFRSLPGIFGEDDRILVENTKRFPYSPIVRTSAQYTYQGNPNAVVGSNGSGVLINKDTVLTAAHCVYSTSEGIWPNKITIYPGLNGTEKPFGSVEVASVELLTNWKSKIDTGVANNKPAVYSEQDIAIVKLKEPVGNATGWFGVTSEADKTKPFAITGYPGEKQNKMHTYQSLLPEKFDAVEGMNVFLNTWEPHTIRYNVFDTTPGNSGSPLYDEQFKVAGVASSVTTYWGTSTRLIGEKYDIAHYWATGGEQKNEDGIEEILLTPASHIVEKTESVQLKAEIKPEAAAEKKIIWTTGDPSVATVDEQGKVTGVKPGTAVITASNEAGTVSATSEITVDDHSNKMELGTDVTDTGKLEGHFSGNRDMDWFVYTPKHGGTYRFRNAAGELVEPYILKEDKTKPYYTRGPWAGPCFYLEEGTTYYVRMHPTVTNEIDAYSCVIEDPFDDPHVQTFVIPIPENTNSNSVTAFSKDQGLIPVNYTLYQAPIGGVLRIRSKAKDAASAMIVSVEIYNEKKERIGKSEQSAQGAEHIAQVTVAPGQKIYYKVIDETPDLREDYTVSTSYSQKW